MHIRCEPQEYFDKMSKPNDLFDFSNLDKDNPLFSTQNKGVPGKFKFEMTSIKEIISLNSKCYSILRDPIRKEKEKKKEESSDESEDEEDAVEIRKCKGVPSAFMNNTKHDYYASILENEEVGYIQSRHIRSKGQQLVTLTQTKRAFTPFDVKRYYLNSTETLAYGNERIKRIKLHQQDPIRSFECRELP
jgi:hypothetical protein